MRWKRRASASRSTGRRNLSGYGVYQIGLSLLSAGKRAAHLLAVVGARGTGRVPFWAAIGIAAVDVVLFAVGVDALT